MTIQRITPPGQREITTPFVLLGCNATPAEISEHNQRVLRRVIHDLGGRLLGGAIIDDSPEAQRIDNLLLYHMPPSDIAAVIDRTLDEVRLYIANRNIPPNSKLSAVQIAKIDTLLKYQVSTADIGSVLNVNSDVIAIYKTNLQYLVTNPAPPRTAIPVSAQNGVSVPRERKEEKKDEGKHTTVRTPLERLLTAPARVDTGTRVNVNERPNTLRATETPTDAAANLFVSIGQQMRPFLANQAYQGLSAEDWRQYKAATLPLHWAVEHRHTHLFSAHAADIGKRNAEGYTPLEWAAVKGVSVAVKPLIELGVNINSLHTSGRPPISFAAEHGHAVFIRTLGTYGVEPNHRCEKSGGNFITPLFVAVSANKLDCVKALIDIGAKVFTGYSYPSYENLIERACLLGNSEMVKLLLSLARLHIGPNPFSAAASGPNPLTILQILYEAGLKDEEDGNKTPAVRQDRAINGFKPGTFMKRVVKDALSGAVHNTHGDQADAVKFLLEKIDDMNFLTPIIKELLRYWEPENIRERSTYRQPGMPAPERPGTKQALLEKLGS